MNPQNSGATCRVPDSGGLGWGPRGFISNKFPLRCWSRSPTLGTSDGDWRLKVQALESVWSGLSAPQCSHLQHGGKEPHAGYQGDLRQSKERASTVPMPQKTLPNWQLFFL